MNINVSDDALGVVQDLSRSIEKLASALNRWCDVREEELT